MLDIDDLEALHDFRVALRRLRSALRAYEALLRDSVKPRFVKRIKKIADASNPARDADVLRVARAQVAKGKIGEGERAGLEWLVARLDQRETASHDELQRQQAEHFPKLDQAMQKRVSMYRVAVSLFPPPKFRVSVAELMRHHALDVKVALAKVQTEADEHLAHEARIEAKRLRYLMEPFASWCRRATSGSRGSSGCRIYWASCTTPTWLPPSWPRRSRWRRSRRPRGCTRWSGWYRSGAGRSFRGCRKVG